MTTCCVSDRAGGCVVAVRVVPRAGRSVIAGERDGSIVIRVSAPPLEGAANAAVIRLLADVLQVPRRAVTILRGGKKRDKLIAVDGLSAQAAALRVDGWLQTATPARGR